MRRGNITIFAAGFLAIILYGKTVLAREYYQLPGVVHVHSTFSSGRYSIEELVAKAKGKNLEVLVLTDHDHVVMEYGLFPLRNLIKRREEKKSVLQIGPKFYLSEIKRVNQVQQSVLVVAGVESSPFYFWKGNPLGEDLTAYDYHKHLLLVGLSDPDDYQSSPRLHGGLSFRYTRELLPRFLVFSVVFFLSIYLIRQKGKVRVGGIVIAIFSLALMIDHHPFKSSRFNPYNGDQGVAPFQETIDYTESRGGARFLGSSGVQLFQKRRSTGSDQDDYQTLSQ